MNDTRDKQRAKAYNRAKIRLKFVDYGLELGVLLIFLVSGASVLLREIVEARLDAWWAVVLGFTAIAGLGYSLLFLPLNWYSGYLLEKKYDLSNQGLGGWLFDWLKELLIGGAIAAVLLLILYGLIRIIPEWWWLVCAAVFTVIFVVLAKLAPVLIMPLFYKCTPLEDEVLVQRLETLASRAGAPVRGVFQFDLSSKTKAANAALAGMGSTRRILLGDTLLESFDHDEVETVLAHELGHHAHRHLLKGMLLQSTFFFAFLFLVDVLLEAGSGWFGFYGPADVANLPLIGLGSSVIGMLLLPGVNGLMRHFERQADRFALSHASAPHAFMTTLQKLGRMNLADPAPHPLIEWMFYSHPSIPKREAMVTDWLSDHGIHHVDLSTEKERENGG